MSDGCSFFIPTHPVEQQILDKKLLQLGNIPSYSSNIQQVHTVIQQKHTAGTYSRNIQQVHTFHTAGTYRHTAAAVHCTPALVYRHTAATYSSNIPSYSSSCSLHTCTSLFLSPGGMSLQPLVGAEHKTPSLPNPCR